MTWRSSALALFTLWAAAACKRGAANYTADNAAKVADWKAAAARPGRAAPVAMPAPPVAEQSGVAMSTAAPDVVQPPDAAQTVDPSSVRDSSTATSMIIRTGQASIEVDSLERAVARVRALAAQLGGFVANSSMQGGRDQVRSATLEIKLPSARWEQAISGLSPIGKVESVNVTAEDVGEEFVDVTARVANARRLEQRLIELLATRTGKLQDVLAVERELARVREEIERYEGRLRYLRAHTATSSLAVTVHERPPLVGDNPGHGVLATALLDAWRNFVSFIAAFISLLGTLIPLAFLIGAGVWLLRRLWRRRPPAPPASTDE